MQSETIIKSKPSKFPCFQGTSRTLLPPVSSTEAEIPQVEGVTSGFSNIFHDIRNLHYTFSRRTGTNTEFSEFDPSKIKREELLAELNRIYLEYGQANWDGEGALPISIKAYREAEKFIAYLRRDLPFPEIFPEKSGEIGIDWRFKEKIVYLTIKEGGYIIFVKISSQNNRQRAVFENSLENVEKILQEVQSIYL